jgi:hypothetical protein
MESESLCICCCGVVLRLSVANVWWKIEYDANQDGDWGRKVIDRALVWVGVGR